MPVPLSESIEVLRRTPATLRSMLEGLPPPWIAADEGPETWSAFDVVGHLIDGEETDWIPRLRIILDHGTAKPFEPFDRFRHKKLNKGKRLGDLLDRFEELRRRSLQELDSCKLTEADLAKPGRHPELGAVTIGQLMATWVAHDLDHVSQIVRVMARRLSRDVGPWKAYLRIIREEAATRG